MEQIEAGMMGINDGVPTTSKRRSAASNKAAGAANWAAKGWTLFWKPNIFHCTFDRNGSLNPANKMKTMDKPKPANFLATEAGAFVTSKNPTRTVPICKFLTYGVYELSRRRSQRRRWRIPPKKRCFFAGKARPDRRHSNGADLRPGALRRSVRSARRRLSPRAKEGESKVIVCRAPADKAHPVFHARWKEFSKDENRIRHLKGKDVFLMFDVSEGGGQTRSPATRSSSRNQRSWPPHNHTDQEEIYIFTKGRGSMEVYADEETKSFVRSVGKGDAVTIPLLNYHPGLQPGRGTALHLVHRRQSLLGRRQEQGFHDRQGGQADDLSSFDKFGSVVVSNRASPAYKQRP